MADDQVYPVSKDWAKRAWVNDARYQEIVGVNMPGRWVSAGVRVGLPRSSRPSTPREDRFIIAPADDDW